MKSAEARAPRRVWIPIALVAVVVIGIAIAVWPRGGSTPVAPVVVVDASRVALSPPDAPDLLAKAREAEHAGKLELAIANYLEAYEASRDPELLFRLGELSERLDRTAEAVTYFQRYLDAASSAKDRDAVTARVSRLSRATPIAAPPDKPAKPSGKPEPKPPVPTVSADPSKFCFCRDPEDKSSPLCKQTSAPMCRCEDPSLLDSWGQLCPERFKVCGERCPPTTEKFEFGDTKFSCPVNWGSFHTRATPGAKCDGYASADLSRDPASAASGNLRHGTYVCSFCRGPNQANIEYAGPSGTECRGHLPATGQLVTSVVRCVPR